MFTKRDGRTETLSEHRRHVRGGYSERYIAIFLAKNWFQLHGAAADGSVVFRKKPVRHKVLDFLASQPNCPVAMEACASAHWWGRGIMACPHAGPQAGEAGWPWPWPTGWRAWPGR